MSDEWFVTMPKLGETVTEGELTTWLKQVGDPVAFDDPLFEVSTDKVDSEIPSPYDGVILEILVPAGRNGSGRAPSWSGSAPRALARSSTGCRRRRTAWRPAVGRRWATPPRRRWAARRARRTRPPARRAGRRGARHHDAQAGRDGHRGQIGSWLKQVGDAVEFDDPLFEVSTDKVDSEIPSPYDGVLLEILVQAGETVPIGTAGRPHR